MRHIFTILSALSAGALLAPIPADAAPGDVTLSATLSTAAETPPTAGDATGVFTGRLNPGTGQLCYTLTSEKLRELTMAHVHVGAPGVAGPPVVVLKPQAANETCIPVDKDLALKIIAQPGGYYVNIHDAAFPKGAIRGQLTAR